ncbi:MAG: patatin-like phospholipase family protein [Bradyrhizobiaceae bacterium]|nr:patatin-like phospholipase family protein [Bradyrhizobiaceae bacterium]
MGATASQQQIVLVLQGGGALGAYQAGVYQGFHEAGVEPDWIVGTSIGAINAVLIAGNPPASRANKLSEFWRRVSQQGLLDEYWSLASLAGGVANLDAMIRGVPGFFEPNPMAAWGIRAPLGVEQAAWYSTEPLKVTLLELVDFASIRTYGTRLTVGAVNVCSGEMRYFDSRYEQIGLEHVMASGALPPGFPAVEIDGQPYWDGGLYSNSPVEVVLDDNPRRDSLIFAVNVWQPRGEAPESIWEVLGRQKDIQYASRVMSHIARQQQIHHLRRIIRELSARLPEDQRADPNVSEMVAYGCHTSMHIVTLLAPRLEGDDCMKDIDFSENRVRARWDAGYAAAQRAVEQRRWYHDPDPMVGVHVHEVADT